MGGALILIVYCLDHRALLSEKPDDCSLGFDDCCWLEKDHGTEPWITTVISA